MLKAVNSQYHPSLLLKPNTRIPIKQGSNVILYSDLFPDQPSLSSIPVLILTYRGNRRILLKTFKRFPLVIKELNRKNELKCYMNDSLIIIEDMLSVSLSFLLKENEACSPLVFECPMINEQKCQRLNENGQYYFDERSDDEYSDNDKHFLDNLIEYFDKEKQRRIKEKEDLMAYLKYLGSSKQKKSTPRDNDQANDKEKDTEIIIVKKCSICLEILNDISYLNTCKHEFCVDCIHKWAKVSSQCPLCKVSFDKILSYTPHKKNIIQRRVKQQKFTLDEDSDEEWYNQCDDTCLICHKGDQTHLLLVCDKCNIHIAHTHCLGLDAIPEGDWYCPICSDKSINRTTRGKRNRNKRTTTIRTRRTTRNTSKDNTIEDTDILLQRKRHRNNKKTLH